MKESNIYIPLWEKYKPAIVGKMKLAISESQEFQLSKHEFEAIGDRSSCGYSFNLEIKNGVLANDISGTAVARDLLEVLKNSKTSKDLIQNNHVKINFSKDFILKIRIKPLQ